MIDVDVDAPRKHGFEQPFDLFQYIAAFAYVLFILAFSILHAPMMTPSVWSYAVTTLLGLWMVCSIVTYIVAAVVQVHDPVIDQTPLTGTEMTNRELGRGEHKCHPCGQVVASSTKHCWSCGKCVSGFDHHCRWLNHCVGERNYLEFAIFLGNTFTGLALQASLGWYLCIETARDFDSFHARAERAFDVSSESGTIALAVFTWFIAVLQLAVIIVLGQLFFLHIELNFRGITTYDLILIKRRASAERKHEREDLGLVVAPTPTCHSLMVWQRKRELGIVDDDDAHDGDGAGKKRADGREMARTGSSAAMYQTQEPHHQHHLHHRSFDDGFGDAAEEDDEPSLNPTPRSSRASSVDHSPGVYRQSNSFRRSRPVSAMATPANNPVSADQHHLDQQHHRVACESQTPVYEFSPRDDGDEVDADLEDDGGVFGTSCTSIGNSGRRRGERPASGQLPVHQHHRRTFSDIGHSPPTAEATPVVQPRAGQQPHKQSLPHAASGAISPDDSGPSPREALWQEAEGVADEE